MNIKKNYSSEMKVIESLCGSVELHQFPPGYYFIPEEGFVQYYTVNLNHNSIK